MECLELGVPRVISKAGIQAYGLMPSALQEHLQEPENLILKKQ